MSLELDNRGHDLPIPDQAQKETYDLMHEKQHGQGFVHPVYLDTTPSPSLEKEQPRKRSSSTPFLLGTALAIMTVLAVIAAAVGGSIATQRQNE